MMYDIKTDTIHGGGWLRVVAGVGGDGALQSYVARLCKDMILR